MIYSVIRRNRCRCRVHDGFVCAVICGPSHLLPIPWYQVHRLYSNPEKKNLFSQVTNSEHSFFVCCVSNMKFSPCSWPRFHFFSPFTCIYYIWGPTRNARRDKTEKHTRVVGFSGAATGSTYCTTIFLLPLCAASLFSLCGSKCDQHIF